MENQVNHYSLIHPTLIEGRVRASHFTGPSHNSTPKCITRSKRQSQIINVERDTLKYNTEIPRICE